MEAPRPGLMLFGSFFPASSQPHGQPPPPPEPQAEPQLELGPPVNPPEPIQQSPDHSRAPKRRRTDKIQKQRAIKRRVSKPLPKRLHPTHIFTRTLFKSDVDNGLNRLTIPRSQILTPFLTDQEEAQLRDLKRLNVTVVDSLGVRALSLTRWNYKNPSGRGSWSYALNGGWMDIVRGNGFVAGDIIQVWSFRIVNGDLGFIIFKQNTGSVAGNEVLDGSSSGDRGNDDEDLGQKKGSNSSV